MPKPDKSSGNLGGMSTHPAQNYKKSADFMQKSADFASFRAENEAKTKAFQVRLNNFFK